MDATQAKQKSESLAQAALSEDLQELSQNPMMLTTMAIIHHREIGLPKERVRLYNLAVDVLLHRWQKRKTDEAFSVSRELNALFKDNLRLRNTMERLAYEAHKTGKGGKEVSEIDRGAALTLLEKEQYLATASLASEFLDYVDQRAGLLIGRGGELNRPAFYSFPHRTFQEYLAGCYIVGQRDVVREYFKLAAEGDYWALAALLGAEELLYNRRSPNNLLDLAYHLYPTKSKTEQETRAGLWCGKMAELLGLTTIKRDVDSPGGGQNYIDRLLPNLVSLLASKLPAQERAEAGVVLGNLHDPREEVTTVSAMPFCFVPSGAFWMGGGESLHLNKELEDDYWISKYPVTHAQFHEFVQAKGYKNEAFWWEAEKAGIWKNGKIRGRYENEFRTQPYPFDKPFHLANHPVVGVTWYEALAFARWLNRIWQDAALLPGGLKVGLPSEAEWEKAARGGEKIAKPPLVLPIGKIGTHGNSSLQKNAFPKRTYPWGDKADPNRANYVDTAIGTTSAVGCFPRGASPYGCEEMSGNVWEWCRAKWRDSYEKPADDSPHGDAPRVLRGGSFPDNADGLRCSSRYRGSPDGWSRISGFRVVLAPQL